MKHAAGIARLMEFRGPERYSDVFDHTMLLAFRSIIVSLEVFHGTGNLSC